MRLLLAFFIMVSISSAFGEYRVYLHQITNTVTQEARTRRSTLDLTGYQNIYPLSMNEKIETIATWKCKGNTSSFKLYCSSE